MSEMLSKDVMVYRKNDENQQSSYELEFKTQDDEYKTMGWVGFNRLLVRLYNDGFFSKDTEFKGLESLAEQVSNTPHSLLGTAQDIIFQNQNSNSVDLDTLVTLKILYNKSKDGYIDNSKREIDSRYENSAYKLDKYFFMALELDYNKDEDMGDFRDSHSIERHETALNFYTNYFYENIKNSSRGIKGYKRDLKNAHTTMEQYIGHEDPNPKLGKYKYKLPGFSDGVIAF